jgi:hypothetical protein
MTSLVNPVLSGKKMELYPNPVGDYLNIQSEYPVEKIVVSDAQGHRIQTINHWTEGQVIQTSAWGKGIYIVKIQTQKDCYNYKVIKK